MRRLIKQYYIELKDGIMCLRKQRLIGVDERIVIIKKLEQHENPINLEKEKPTKRSISKNKRSINSLLKSTDSDSSKSDLQQEEDNYKQG